MMYHVGADAFGLYKGQSIARDLVFALFRHVAQKTVPEAINVYFKGTNGCGLHKISLDGALSAQGSSNSESPWLN